MLSSLPPKSANARATTAFRPKALSLTNPFLRYSSPRQDTLASHYLSLRPNHNLLAPAKRLGQISLPPSRLGCILLPMSFRPIRKIAGIGNVFLGTELVDIAEYDLEIYEENPEDHEHHGANWTPGAKKIEGTVVGELPIRKDLRLLTEEGYSVKFYLRDSFGSVVIVNPILDSGGNPVR